MFEDLRKKAEHDCDEARTKAQEAYVRTEHAIRQAAAASAPEVFRRAIEESQREVREEVQKDRRDSEIRRSKYNTEKVNLAKKQAEHTRKLAELEARTAREREAREAEMKRLRAQLEED